jgi:hypothetical protein
MSVKYALKNQIKVLLHALGISQNKYFYSIKLKRNFCSEIFIQMIEQRINLKINKKNCE